MHLQMCCVKQRGGWFLLLYVLQIPIAYLLSNVMNLLVFFTQDSLEK